MFRYVFLIFLFIPGVAWAFLVQPLGPLSGDEKLYKKALKSSPKKQCSLFAKLSNKENFLLRELALIRSLEKCKLKKTSERVSLWTATLKKIKNPFLKSVGESLFFQFLLDQKAYKQALSFHLKEKNSIDLNSTNFQTWSGEALKQNLDSETRAYLKDKMGQRSSEFLVLKEKKNFLKRAQNLTRQRKFFQAIKFYKKILNTPGFSDEERHRAFKGACQNYKLQGWKGRVKYLKALGQWSRSLKDKYKRSKQLTRWHHEANVAYVRALWTHKGQKEAQRVLLNLETELKGSHSLEVLYWLRGRMAEEKNNLSQAIYWLKKARGQDEVWSNQKIQILWSLAWIERKMEKYQASIRTLKELIGFKNQTHFNKTKFKYWMGENFYSLNKNESGKKIFKELTEIDSLGYYGALAFRRLKIPFPPISRPSYSFNKTLVLLKKKDQKYIQSLLKVGEVDLAQDRVGWLLKPKEGWGLGKWVQYFMALQSVGSYKEFLKQYYQLPFEGQSAIAQKHPDLLFPNPYSEEVNKVTGPLSISSALVYSVMRQESSFDPSAQSPAHAFGLMQVLPSVARRWIQKHPKTPYKTPKDLFQPSLSINLGASLLNQLFLRWAESFIPSVASYNASPHAVQNWVRSSSSKDPITFIENIPYEETKGYVKLVMRNFIAYTRLSKGGSGFMFPERLLSSQFLTQRKLNKTPLSQGSKKTLSQNRFIQSQNRKKSLKVSRVKTSKSKVLRRMKLKPFKKGINPLAPKSIIMNDPHIPKKWGLEKSQALKALQLTRGSRKIVVAIVDTGADIHPDLKGNLWKNPGESGQDRWGKNKAFNGRDDDGNGLIDDVHGWNFVHSNNFLKDNHGHGTHIAGIVGAEGGNGIGVTGVAPKVSLMILKYLDPKDPNSPSQALIHTISAFNYAVNNGAHIINYSGGGTEFSAEEYQAVKKAQQKGILFVAAAGNEHSNSDFYKYYPADYELDNIISVTALNPQLRVLTSSNYGIHTVDIAAPGENIYSTLPGGQYGTMTGTSQATAFVSGVAALLMAHNRDFDARAVKKYILRTGDRLSWLQTKTKTSKKLNVYRALTMLDQGVGASGVVPQNINKKNKKYFEAPSSSQSKEKSSLKDFGHSLLKSLE